MTSKRIKRLGYLMTTRIERYRVLIIVSTIENNHLKRTSTVTLIVETSSLIWTRRMTLTMFHRLKAIWIRLSFNRSNICLIIYTNRTKKTNPILEMDEL